MYNKKVFTLLLASSMIFAVTGCYSTMPISDNASAEETSEVAADESAGAAETVAEEQEKEPTKIAVSVSDENAGDDLFRQVLLSPNYLTDGTYTQVMYCGSHSTSNASDMAKDAKGTDYIYVCRFTGNDSKDSVETYAVVTMSVYTDGTLRGVDVLHSDVETYLDLADDGETMTGGWTISPIADIEDGLSKTLSSALENYSGYTVSGILGTQVVSGTNYRVLCTYTEEDETKYAIGTVYVDLDENAELTELVNISDGTDLLQQSAE